MVVDECQKQHHNHTWLYNYVLSHLLCHEPTLNTSLTRCSLVHIPPLNLNTHRERVWWIDHVIGRLLELGTP